MKIKILFPHLSLIAAQSVSLIIGIILPSVTFSVYFYSSRDSINNNSDITDSGDINNVKPKFSLDRAVKLLWKHFVESYSNSNVIQWSLWYKKNNKFS